MFLEYIIAGAVILLLAIASYILIRATIGDIEKTRIEIVIDGDSAEDELEYAVITAKIVAEKYFKNCDVYIRGGDNDLTDALCRTYGTIRKEC